MAAITRKSIPRIPEVIFPHIFRHNSPKFLFSVARLVCKYWARIISSPSMKEVSSYFSPLCFLFRDDDSNETCHSIYFKVNHLHPSLFLENLPGILMGNTTNGVLLLYDLKNPRLIVMNPVTRQVSRLPDVDTGNNFSTANMGYVNRTKKFKIVCTCPPFNNLKWRILTLNSECDMLWREMNDVPRGISAFLRNQHMKYHSFSFKNLVVYWDPMIWMSDNYFIIVNLMYETFHLVRGPIFWELEKSLCLMPMEEELYAISFMTSSILSKNSGNMRIWRIVDFGLSKWENVFDRQIPEQLKSHLANGKQVHFNAWFPNERVLIFTKLVSITRRDMIAYDFKLGLSHVIKVGSSFRSSILLPHHDSLLSW